MGNCDPSKTNVDIGFSLDDNFPCYPLVQSTFIFYQLSLSQSESTILHESIILQFSDLYDITCLKWTARDDITYWNQIGDFSFQIHSITYWLWIHVVTLWINSKWINQNHQVLYLQQESITADLENALVFKFYGKWKNIIIFSTQSFKVIKIEKISKMYQENSYVCMFHF